MFLSHISRVTHLDSYLKNWRYGQSGATISVKDSQFLGVPNHFQTDTRSSIAIEGSQLPNGYTTEGNVLLDVRFGVRFCRGGLWSILTSVEVARVPRVVP